MKKLISSLLTKTLVGSTIFSLIACNKPNGEQTKDQIEKENDARTWSEFNDQLEEIGNKYFSTANEIRYNLASEEEKPTIEHYTYFQKVKAYKEWKDKKSKLPKINNNRYEHNINKIFLTLELWIVYMTGWDSQYPIVKFKEIFNFFDSEDDNKSYVKLKKVNLDFINILWEYKSENYDEDLKIYVKKYNYDTQIKLFQYIQFYKYIEQEFTKPLIRDPNKKLNYIKLKDYEEYIDKEYYNEWVENNKNDKGYNSWKVW